MIGSLRGTVAFLGSDSCILDTAGGVGYRVYMPSSHLARLAKDKEVNVHVHTAVREDAILLFGFLSRDYFELFELLLTVSGVGPKMALGLLSAVRPEQFYLAVQNRDMKALTKLPGIGKKTAERMLLELKDKVSGGENADVFTSTGTPDGSLADNVNDAIEALQSLGYSSAEVIPVIRKIDGYSDLAGEELLRRALKLLAAK